MKDDAVLYRAVYVYVIYVHTNIIAFRSDQPNWDKNLEFTF